MLVIDWKLTIDVVNERCWWCAGDDDGDDDDDVDVDEPYMREFSLAEREAIAKKRRPFQDHPFQNSFRNGWNYSTWPYHTSRNFHDQMVPS